MGGSLGVEGVHGNEEGGECGGGIGALGGLCGALSLAHTSYLVIDNDEGISVKKGVREHGSTHAGGGMVVVSGLSQVGDADASRLYGEGEEGAEVSVVVVGVLPPRRAGRKVVRMAVSIHAK